MFEILGPSSESQTGGMLRSELRVAFDPQIFCHQRFGGISRYFANLVLEMHKIQEVQPRIIAPFHFNEYLDQLPPTLVQGTRVRWLEGLTALAYGASVLPARAAAARFRPHIQHNTYYFPVRPTVGSRALLTVHDLIHERFPNLFLASPFITRIKSASVRAADHVICVSESTRQDLLKHYDVAEERVSVIYHGFDPMQIPVDSASAFRKRILGADAPYLLYVGNRAAYKNFAGLLSAFAASTLRNSYQLLCFGGGRFTRSERVAIDNAGVANRVHQISGSDAVLAACYGHASLYVCPSLYEGFGIPVLEAMSADCPVACSNSSSLPEVAGDAACFFDPLVPDSIRSVLEDVLGSGAKIDQLKIRGRQRIQQFSWRRCAEQTLELYRKVIAS